MKKYYLVPAHLYDGKKDEKKHNKGLELVGIFPEKNRSKVKMLITQLSECGVMLGENNRVKLGERVLDGSNYVDLLRYLLYGLKEANKWGEIYNFMMMNNFPTSLIPKRAGAPKIEPSGWISL